MIESAQTQNTTSSKSGGKGRYVAFGIGVILLIGLFLAFAWQLQTRESTQLQGNMAPQFELTTFEGDQITLSELQGQIVVVNFWASWCVECYDEAPLLEEAYQDFKDQGVVFLGVDYLDTEKEAQGYISQYGITYPNGYDLRSEISETFQLTGVPETFFIDRDGSIHHVQIGPIERPQLYQLLQDLTAGGTS